MLFPKSQKSIEKSEKLKDLQEQKKILKMKLEEEKKEQRELKDIAALRQKVDKKNKRRVPKNIGDCIYYEKLFEDGLMQVDSNTFSKSVMFDDINYQDAGNNSKKSIFNKYSSFLNHFDSNTHVQITIRNRRLDEEEFTSNISIPKKEDYGFPSKYVGEFNRVLRESTIGSDKSMVHEKYITFSCDAENPYQASKLLGRIETSMASSLNELGCKNRTLNGYERVRLLHEYLRPNEREFNFDYSYLLYDNRTTKDYIYPSLLDFQSNKKGRYFLADDFNGDYVGCTLSVNNLPPELEDDFINELVDINCNLTVTIHLTPIEPEVAINSVQTRITYMEAQKIEAQRKAIKEGYDPEMYNSELKRSLHEAEILLKQLQDSNQKMMFSTILIYTYADSIDALEDNIFKIASVARKKSVGVEYLSLQQCNGLNSTLPLGVNFTKPRRTLTTASAAVFIPFTTQELMMKGGQFYGINALSRNVLSFDRRTLKVANGLVLATPGSGKSFISKEELFHVLATTNDSVIIIDPEAEYVTFTQALNGEVIDISASSSHKLNPFECDDQYADDEDPKKLKSDSLLSLFEVLVGNGKGLTSGQRSILDRCILKVYDEYFSNPERTKADMPTMRRFYSVLKEQKDEEVRELVLALETYINGSLSIFADLSNVDCNNRLIDFNILKLRGSLKTAGTMVVLDTVWNKIIENHKKGIRTWIYIDELHLFFKNEWTATFFFELWKRARKWGAVPTGITQNVEDILKSDIARTMLSNTDFLLLLNQAEMDARVLADLKNISKEQLNYITDSAPGRGLLIAEKSIIPFVNEFPKDTELYRLMSTKFNEEVIA